MNIWALILLISLLGIVYARPEEKYTSKYDNINLENILQNERLLNNYLKCLLDKGKCTSEGTELRRIVPEAIMTDCHKCNPKQKAAIKRVLLYLSEKRRPEFDQLIGKYDPEGIYRTKYKTQYEEAGIKF